MCLNKEVVQQVTHTQIAFQRCDTWFKKKILPMSLNLIEIELKRTGITVYHTAILLLASIEI